MNRLDLTGAMRLVGMQAMATGICAFGSWILAPESALYTIAAGLIATIANAVFALLLFTGASEEESSGRLLGAEFLKLILTATLIGVFLWWKKPPEPGLALVFMAVFLLIYLLPGLVMQLQSKQTQASNGD